MKKKDPKQDWPRWMKEQYNEEIRRRRAIKEKRERFLDEQFTPQIWRMPLNETNVFSMLAYIFPFNMVIKKILQKFFRMEDRRNLKLSSSYLQVTQNIFPGYYSDRERIIVMLNRYRVTGDLENFVKWLPFHSDKTSVHLIHLMVGLFFLDQYLNNLSKDEFLIISLSHFQKGQRNFQTIEARLAFHTLIAFAHYMNRDFQVSRLRIVEDLTDDEEFQGKFLRLVEQEAA